MFQLLEATSRIYITGRSKLDVYSVIILYRYRAIKSKVFVIKKDRN